MLHPLVLDPSEEEGLLRYRQIEFHRMPLMAFLSVDDPRGMSREDWLRLGLVATLHPVRHLFVVVHIERARMQAGIDEAPLVVFDRHQ